MDKSGYVYLIAGSGPCAGYYKIGKSDDPAKRIKQLTHMPFPVSMIHMVKCENVSIIETGLHRLFSEKRVYGEWFLLDADTVSVITSCNTESEFAEIIGDAETKSVQISLRLTPYVYEILKKRSIETGHSLNGEVIQAILEHCEASIFNVTPVAYPFPSAPTVTTPTP